MGDMDGVMVTKRGAIWSCVHCHHVAAKHVQTDTEVWCETCDAVCYVPANIDDDLWIGGPHDPS